LKSLHRSIGASGLRRFLGQLMDSMPTCPFNGIRLRVLCAPGGGLADHRLPWKFKVTDSGRQCTKPVGADPKALSGTWIQTVPLSDDRENH